MTPNEFKDPRIFLGFSVSITFVIDKSLYICYSVIIEQQEIRMTNTNPGADLIVVTYETVEHHGHFNESGPLGGVSLGSTTHRHRGVLRTDIGDQNAAYVMRLDKNGDFSSWTTKIKPVQIIHAESATINDKHELVLL